MAPDASTALAATHQINAELTPSRGRTTHQSHNFPQCSDEDGVVSYGPLQQMVTHLQT
ncbi:unnamed protein product [Arabidopsis lyrata]|nr:unnamed protein product [Arabidopsis lyrata]